MRRKKVADETKQSAAQYKWQFKRKRWNYMKDTGPTLSFSYLVIFKYDLYEYQVVNVLDQNWYVLFQNIPRKCTQVARHPRSKVK